MRQPALRVPVRKRSVVAVITAILALFLAGPALAEYLGPDRVTVEFKEVRDPDNDVWTLTHVDPNDGFLDVCLIIHTCEEHPSVVRQRALCGWTADNSGCDRAYKIKEVTVVLPEATISSDLQGCTLVDGWCMDTPTLHLAGTEPVAGETITLIEGTRNGEPFACPGAVCDVPLVQGGNQFTFWALSSWGDSSQMGTLSAQVDSKGPTVRIPDSWYIWEPLAIQVEDAQHGIDKVTLDIDGGEYGDRSYSWAGSVVPDDFIWDRHFGEIIAPIGDYPVTVKAKDSLGNIATAHGEIVIPEPEPPAESQEASALPQSAGLVEEPSELLAWLIDPYPFPSSGPAGSGDEPGVDMAGAEDAEQQASVLSGDESAGASAQVGAVRSGVTTEGGGTGLLWGAAALAAAASATAYGLSRRRAREEYIREMRERAAEMSSPEARQARLTSLWNAAQARVASIRAAIASGTRATATAATSAAAAVATAAAAAAAAASAVVATVAAAAAAAAAEARRRADEALRQRAQQRRGEREARLEQAEQRPPLEAPRMPSAEAPPVDPWRQIELQRARESDSPSPQTGKDVLPTSTPSPSPQPLPARVPTPAAVPTSMPGPETRRGPNYNEIVALLGELPHLRGPLTEFREPKIKTILPNGILEVGSQRSLRLATAQNEGLWIGTDGSLGARSGEPPASASTSGSSWRLGFRIPGGTLHVPNSASAEPQYLEVSNGSSVYVSFDPSGFWNSAITLDLSPVDLSASVGSGRILGSSGVYIRFKPAPFLLVGVVVTVLTLTPIPDEFSLPVLARGLLEFVRP